MIWSSVLSPLAPAIVTPPAMTVPAMISLARIVPDPVLWASEANPDDVGLDAPDVNPYGMQTHRYDKTQPENVDFLRRFRALLDEYEGRMTVGEVGDGARSLKTVADYTSGGDKLNMCYTFDLLGPDFTAGHIRKCVERFQKVVTDGWVCWAFSNHDVVRHVSRWGANVLDREAYAKMLSALLLTQRGSVTVLVRWGPSRFST